MPLKKKGFFVSNERSCFVAVSKIQCDYDFGTYKVFEFKTHLVLQCNVTLEAGDESAPISWLKNEKPLPSEDRIKSTSKGNIHTLTITHAADADAGNYTIVVKSSAAEQRGEITAACKFIIP